MAEFKRASLTQKGLALLAKAQTGGAPITITAAVSGSGTYTADEDISQQTALKEQKQELLDAVDSLGEPDREIIVRKYFNLFCKKAYNKLYAEILSYINPIRPDRTDKRKAIKIKQALWFVYRVA